MKNYCENENTNLDYKSRSSYEESFSDAENTFLIIGAVLSFILGLIGLLNFVNSMITSISAREHEFAVLRSVGMTGGQLKSMIMCEGGLYAVISVLFMLTAGNLLCYGFVMAVANQMWFFTYRPTVMPLIVTLPALLALSVLIPFICYSAMCRKSIAEELAASE